MSYNNPHGPPIGREYRRFERVLLTDGVLAPPPILNCCKRLKMQIAHTDGFDTFAIEYFYDVYREHVLKIFLENSKTTAFMCHLVEELVTKNGVSITRHDVGCQFLSWWTGDWEYSEREIALMQLGGGIDKFLTYAEYLRLAKLGMAEFSMMSFYVSDFEKHVNASLEIQFGKSFDITYLESMAFSKDVIFPKLKNVMRVGMLKEIMQNNPGAKIYLT